jgi:hypothetical protein
VTGVHVSLTLNRRQAAAILGAELSAGYGVRRSAALVEAGRRLKDAVQRALDNDVAPRPMQTEPGA